MKTKLFTFLCILVFTFSAKRAQSQFYCFWVANQSGEEFNELKIRVTGSNAAFGRDLLPSNVIESGKHFWIKTGNDKSKLWDVQITRMDGTPLLFTWKGTNGQWYKNRPYITVSAQDLHTLVIADNENGELSFEYYVDDRLHYGHPCDN